MASKIFFNTSIPRSGSTVFQNLMNQNPEFYATGTDGVAELLYNSRNLFSNLPEFKAHGTEPMLRAWRGFCRGAMEGYVDALTDKPNVILKSRVFIGCYDWFSNFLDGPPKFICCIRDLRQVMASFEKIHRRHPDYSNSFETNPENPIFTTTQRTQQLLFSPPIKPYLERLYDAYLKKQSENFLFVRYEDLTSAPKKEMERVYNFLEISYFEHDFNNIDQSIQEDDRFYMAGNDLHKIRSKLEPLQKDYLDILGKESCDMIISAAPWYFDFFNYHRN
jgi:sulfotransferase